MCKHSIKPVILSRVPFNGKAGSVSFAVTYLCRHCFEPFLGFYQLIDDFDDLGQLADQVFLEPTRFTPVQFDQKVEALSPAFVEIYNQARAAESQNLDQIAGIGYRKSVEFLVKDFCISRFPDEADSIKNKLLARVIADYIDNQQIKTLAERAVWIGNDETHYVRKHDDRDITDMKAFIQAMVYFVGMSLIADDAASMSPA